MMILSAVASAFGASCASKSDKSLGNTGGSAGSTGMTGGTSMVVVTGGSAGTGATGGTGGSSSGGTDMGTAATAGDTGSDSCADLTGLDCGGAKIEAKVRTVNMLLVIDKSGSMTDPFGDQNKWTALKSALGTALTNVRTEMNFGMIMYPYSLLHTIPEVGCGDVCCDIDPTAAAVTVPVAPGTVTVMQIGDQLDRTEPGGGTPTAKALAAAYDYFKNGDGASLQGDNYVLLATDGGPNCNADITCEGATCTTNLDGQCTASNCCQRDESHNLCLDADAVTIQLEALYAEHISTFVVGLPGTLQYSTYLDGFADAGGVPNPAGDTRYYAVSADNGVQGLVDVFETITTQLVRSCEIPLTDPPSNTKLVNVAIDCNLVPPDSPDGSGWHFDQDIDPTQLILVGPVCDRLQNNGAKRVDVIFGCTTVR